MNRRVSSRVPQTPTETPPEDRLTPQVSDEMHLPRGDPIDDRIRELVKTEWGVAYERGRVTACESEQAARKLQAASGGELVYRRTWITTWS
jgi:hypothetical protein